MMKNILIIGVISALVFSSCKETPKQENIEKSTTETVEKVNDDIVTTTATNNNGEKIVITFNNTKKTASINFNGDTIELDQQKSASGFWFKNNTYELRGKGNDIELKKNNEVIFEYSDDIVSTSLKNKEGKILNMTFNNSTNKVKVYLNGGEQIELDGQKAASGIWYKNNQYELRGKGENLTLTKNGKVIFEN